MTRQLDTVGGADVLGETGGLWIRFLLESGARGMGAAAALQNGCV
jgi:hypothetical protein